MNRRRFLAVSLLTSLQGCTGSAPTPPTLPSPVIPQATIYTVSGIVVDASDGRSSPVANQPLTVFIHETEGVPQGITLRGSVQSLTTDQEGRYTAHVPKSRVYVSVWGKRQPCLASASVASATTLDVQVFTDSPGGAPPGAAPIVTGFVYERTSDGRRPLRGAHAWLDLGIDAYAANTVTDETGHFYLCRVDTRVRMDVFADGYEPYQYAEFITGTGDRSFEFEFRR